MGLGVRVEEKRIILFLDETERRFSDCSCFKDVHSYLIVGMEIFRNVSTFDGKTSFMRELCL